LKQACSSVVVDEASTSETPLAFALPQFSIAVAPLGAIWVAGFLTCYIPKQGQNDEEAWTQRTCKHRTATALYDVVGCTWLCTLRYSPALLSPIFVIIKSSESSES
jgi:hypothetical protein